MNTKPIDLIFVESLHKSVVQHVVVAPPNPATEPDTGVHDGTHPLVVTETEATVDVDD